MVEPVRPSGSELVYGADRNGLATYPAPHGFTIAPLPVLRATAALIAQLPSRPGRAAAPRGRSAAAHSPSRLRAWVVAAACVLAAVLGAAPAQGQVLQLYREHEGPFDYVVTGNSFRTQSNSGNPCTVATTADATLTIPTGATVVAAYLFWGGSEAGTPDNTVTFRRPGTDVSVTGDGTPFTDIYDNGDNLRYFGAYKDVTSLMAGSGTYGVGDLTVDTGSPYCAPQAVAKGWSLMVVYRINTLPIKRIQIRHGLRAFRLATELVTLDGFLASNTPSAKVTFLLYEGDPDIAGAAGAPEQLLFNGAPFTDGINPNNNPFNSTINTPAPGRTNAYGLDLDTYDASSFFAPRDRSAEVQLTAGNDMVVLQVILTALNVALVDVTPDGLPTPETRLPGRYSRQFQVENASLSSDSYDLLGRFTGAPAFLTSDSITGTGVTRGTRTDSARVTIPAGGLRTVNVWYTVPQGVSQQNLIHLRARSTTYPTNAAAADTGYTQMVRVSPRLTITKSVSPNNTLAPGTELTYTMQIANAGEFAARSVAVSDSVPPQVVFKLGSVSQTLPAGITATVQYSNNAGTTWTYVPVSTGCGAPAGYDACVRRVRWTLTGDLPAGAPASTSSFVFQARIK
jgi:trimeric autotransporter adhesin